MLTEIKDLMRVVPKALIFPFNLGVLLYNVIFTLLSGGLTVILGLALMTQPPQATEGLLIAVFIGIIFIYILAGFRHFDVLLQIKNGDTDKPSFSPVGHTDKPFSYLGLVLVVLVWAFVLGLIVGLFGVISETIANAANRIINLVFVMVYPLIAMTYVKTNSIKRTFNPSEWMMILDEIGNKAYGAMLVWFFTPLIFIVVLMAATVLFLLSLQNEILFIVTMILYSYLFFHYATYMHYLIGHVLFSMPEDGGDEPEGGRRAKPAKPKKKSPEQEVIDEAMGVFRDGYPEDAINLLNNALNYEFITAEDTLKVYDSLEKIYQSQNNMSQVTQARKSAFDFVTREAPHLKARVLPKVLGLIDSDDLHVDANEALSLGQSALELKRYDTALKIAMHFIKTHGSHPDLLDMHIVAGRALVGQNNLQKGYQVLGKTFKKLDKSDARYFDLKSELLALKRRIEKSGQ